jgi:ABC-type polysaccharide/polyol phosphate export permease
MTDLARPARPNDAVVIESARRTVSLPTYVREAWERRRLVRVLAARQLRSTYEINIVGFAWWLLEPLSLALVYYALFTFIFRRNQPHYLLTLLVALLPFKWLSQTTTQSMGTIRGNAALILDVYFPRALLPVTEAVVGLAHFGVALLVLPLTMLAYRTWGGIHIVWLPVIAAVQLVLIMGIAFPMSVWGIGYRNLPGVVSNALRLWFYLSPGIWTLELVEKRRLLIRTLVWLNPLTGLLDGYRRALIEGRPPGLTLAWTAIVAVGLFAGGLAYFVRREGQFGKML